MFAEACANGWEGVIAKRADSVYTDKRSKRLAEVQVRAGPGAGDRRLHAAPSGSREEFGALLVGALRGDGGCTTPARSAPASTARR